MTIARRQLIDVSVARWYHCMSRCVRGASLLRSESSDRKAWLEDRIEELAQIFALGVGGFSVMDNHLHLLLRLDPEVASLVASSRPAGKSCAKWPITSMCDA